MKTLYYFFYFLLSQITYSEVVIPLEKASKESRYTTQVKNRPKTLPRGIFAFSLASYIRNFKHVDVDAGMRLGLNDFLEGILEIGGISFPELQDARLKRTVVIGAKYWVWDMQYFRGSIEGKLPIHIWDGEIVRSFVFSIPSEALFKDFCFGFLHEFLIFNMRPTMAFEINLPLYFGMQIDHNLWTEINTSLGHIKMTNVNHQGSFKETRWLGQRLPLKIKALYAFNRFLDLGLETGFYNIYKAKNTFNLGLLINIRGGNL